MDDGVDDRGLGQTKGVAKEETQGESGRGGAERGQRGVWSRMGPRGKVDGEVRSAARKEVWPYRGPRGMDDGRKI